MTQSIKGKDKVFFGKNEHGERIYLQKPTWDCGWYWSFGYLGNKDCHYHLDGYQKKDHCLKLEDGNYKHITEKRNICMRDALLADYELNPVIEENLWVFCELALSIYSLKETAEVLGRGGSHMTNNPCQSVIKNKTEVKRINEIVIPALCQELWDMLTN